MRIRSPFIDGHFLNLPVLEDDGTLVGCVDVLKLTYATLEQVGLQSHAFSQPTTRLICLWLPCYAGRVHRSRWQRRERQRWARWSSLVSFLLLLCRSVDFRRRRGRRHRVCSL